jgi:uncharacterized membrane protein
METSMNIAMTNIPAILALLVGILILIMPRFLNYLVAIYLIVVGLFGLGVLRGFLQESIGWQRRQGPAQRIGMSNDEMGLYIR